MSNPIKVVLVEDSPVALNILHRLLDEAPEIEVVGTASEGREGLGVIASTQPDVVCTDLQMPGMDGLEFTKQVMSDCPRPVLVISNAVQPTDIDNIYSLMQAGAMDFFPKPTTGTPTDYEKMRGALVTKIRVLNKKKA